MVAVRSLYRSYYKYALTPQRVSEGRSERKKAVKDRLGQLVPAGLGIASCRTRVDGSRAPYGSTVGKKPCCALFLSGGLARGRQSSVKRGEEPA